MSPTLKWVNKALHINMRSGKLLYVEFQKMGLCWLPYDQLRRSKRPLNYFKMVIKHKHISLNEKILIPFTPFNHGLVVVQSNTWFFQSSQKGLFSQWNLFSPCRPHGCLIWPFLRETVQRRAAFAMPYKQLNIQYLNKPRSWCSSK